MLDRADAYCRLMPSKNATLNDHIPALGVGQLVALNAQGQPPEWVMLVPKGPRIVGNDGRVFSPGA